MLKTLDILIGIATVMLLFSMAVTVVTQFVNQMANNSGRFLKQGLSSLLRQIDPNMALNIANEIATALLKNPMIADGRGREGSVIHRGEFTRLLMDFASDNTPQGLSTDAKVALLKLLESNDIPNPGQTVDNIRAAALQLEATHPQLSNDARQTMAILQEASTKFVGKINGWFDQTIDRVSHNFTSRTRWVSIIASLIVAAGVQLDVVALLNRLSLDDGFRAAAIAAAPRIAEIAAPTPAPGTNKAPGAAPSPTQEQTAPAAPSQPAKSAITVPGGPRVGLAAGSEASISDGSEQKQQTPDPQAPGNPSPQQVKNEYYTLLNDAGLIVMPGGDWWSQFDARKIPGILLATLLLSLGAPFWYEALKKLLQLKSVIAQKDDAQRAERQSTQEPPKTEPPAAPPGAATGISVPPATPQGESGDLKAMGAVG